MRLQHLSMICLLYGLCLSLSCLSGCGTRQATVKGKVSINGQNLTVGTVGFVGKDRSATGQIKSDGTYTVTNAPVGEVTITVVTPPPTMGGMMNAPKAPAGVPAMPKEMLPPDHQENKSVQVVPVPTKYNKVESSTLKYIVQSGSQEYNIDLKP